MSRVPRPYCGLRSATNASATASTSSTPFNARRPPARPVSKRCTTRLVAEAPDRAQQHSPPAINSAATTSASPVPNSQ